MSKLPVGKTFFDFSDYSRFPAVIVAKLLKDTRISSIAVTWLFTIIGLFAAFLIYNYLNLLLAATLLIIKSFLDAVDGELARIRSRPSHIGRYLDSVNDFFINLCIFLSLSNLTGTSIYIALLSLSLYQLQGSLYNYYYVIRRYQSKGDLTSRINESKLPTPYPWDNPKITRILHRIFLIIYRWQDWIVFRLDPRAVDTKELPNWFLTLISINGLGFQLLIIAFFLAIDFPDIIILLFLGPFTVYSLLLILIRRILINK
jgi:phosphatidylglycerophosphate synthase